MIRKTRFFIIIITFVGALIISLLIILKCVWPIKIHEIRTNIVYTTGNYVVTRSRYFIELKSNGTYILMYDGTLGKEEDYGPEAGAPYIEYRKGTYEKKGTDYILHATEGGGVEFRDLEAVKRKEIFAKGRRTEEQLKENTQYNLDVAWKTQENEYKVGGLHEDGSYGGGYLLYTSDRKDIPDSLEELFDEYELAEE